MANFGTNVASSASGGSLSVNETIVGGGLFPATPGVLANVHLYGSRYDATYNRVRAAVYQGGASNTDPSGATLVWEGLMTVTDENGAVWRSIAASGSLAANTRTWLAIRTSSEFFPHYANSGDRGEATFNTYRWATNNPATGFDATVPAATQFTTSAFKWSIEYTEGGAPAITSISDATLAHGQTGVVIDGTGFSASGNTVLVSPSDDVDDVNAVAQTITAEGATQITFTADLDSFTIGQTLYVFVVNGDTESNAAGEVVSRAVASATLNFTGSNKFIDESGAAVQASGLTLYVWRAPRPPSSGGAPDQILTAQATDVNGEASIAIDPGALAPNDTVFCALFAADGTDLYWTGEFAPDLA